MNGNRPTPGLYHGIFWIGVIAFVGMALGGLYHAFTRYNRPPAIALSYLDNIKAKFESRQYDEAAEQLRTSLMIESGGAFSQAQLELSLGNALASHGAVKQAIPHFEQAVKIDPGFAQGHYALGVVILEQGNEQAAESCFQTAIELDEDYAAPHFGMGKLYQAQGQTAASIDHFQKALSLFEKEPVKHEHQAISLEPDQQAFAGVCNMLAVTRFRAGDFKAALAHVTRALEMNENYAEAHNNAGLIYLQLGQPDKALEHLAEALRINPRFQAAQLHHDEAMRQLQQK
jgi:tetratricopeptide (TPR) repeat protein